MRILILVQSCLADPYPNLMRYQQNTWDSIRVPGVDTAYYMGSGNLLQEILQERPDRFTCLMGAPDDLKMAHWKMKLAMDHIPHIEDYDFVFRTNASSYCDKAMILQKAMTLPIEKCYCGLDGGGFASGCGVFLSRDLVKILRENIDSEPTDFEDAYMGSILRKHGITITPGADRQNIDHGNYGSIRDCYHYRCKSDTSDRWKDITAFGHIHQFKLHK